MCARGMLLLLLLLTPSLMAAAPLIVADLEPDFEEILDEEASSSSSKSQPKALRRFFYHKETNKDEDIIPDYIMELDQIATNENENPRTIEEKRSGLRAAMLARGGRGVKLRTGWQVGGPSVTMYSDQDINNSYITRRSQDEEEIPSKFVGAVSRGLNMRRQRKSNTGSLKQSGILSNVDGYFGVLQGGIGDYSDVELSKLGIRNIKPIVAEDAYLHGGTLLRPSDKVRLFVQDRGPMGLRGANGHDPGILWTGVGRR